MMYGRSPTEISEGGAVASAIGFASAGRVSSQEAGLSAQGRLRVGDEEPRGLLTSRRRLLAGKREMSKGDRDPTQTQAAENQRGQGRHEDKVPCREAHGRHPGTEVSRCDQHMRKCPIQQLSWRLDAALGDQGGVWERTRLQPLLQPLLQPQIGLLDMWALEQALARALEHDPPVFQDIAPVAELQRAQHVLLDEEDGQPFRVDALEILEDELDHYGGEAQARLVEHEKPWLGHEAPADGAHLLLSARQRARHLSLALGEPGK